MNCPTLCNTELSWAVCMLLISASVYRVQLLGRLLAGALGGCLAALSRGFSLLLRLQTLPDPSGNYSAWLVHLTF